MKWLCQMFSVQFNTTELLDKYRMLQTSNSNAKHLPQTQTLTATPFLLLPLSVYFLIKGCPYLPPTSLPLLPFVHRSLPLPHPVSISWLSSPFRLSLSRFSDLFFCSKKPVISLCLHKCLMSRCKIMGLFYATFLLPLITVIPSIVIRLCFYTKFLSDRTLPTRDGRQKLDGF